MTDLTIKLNNGELMPAIGLGTWRANESGLLAQTIKTAIGLGYRHIDCAKLYSNQEEIGKALKEVDVPRKDLFIVSKFEENRHRPELVAGALDEILNELQLEYLDLLLMHWPYAIKPEANAMSFASSDIENVPIMDTWQAMEDLVGTGKVRSIGVSNFNQTILEKMIPQCRIVPAVNQVEIHPYLQAKELVKFCKKSGIAVTGYCPLGGRRVNVMNDNFIKHVAEAHIGTPAQVALSWALARGIAVIPKSTNEIRLKQNLHQVTLTSDEMRMIGKIERHERKVDPASDNEELEWVFHEDKMECPVI
ncbi:hypothetical protein IWW57_001727 [Coemansia sp. S610]|nr:hypothetical protein IWW57_001727 [Coemansia sp. S610]KAJ2703823.1 hypothetical protein H4218_000062 [Coemansia sp. IMI 209128]